MKWKIVRFAPGAIALSGAAAASACSTQAPAAAGNIVTLKTDAAPALLAFRDEASADWQGLPVKGATRFDIATHGAYQIVIACDANDQDRSVTILLYGRTPDDDPSITGGCLSPAPFDVRGTMIQPGEVALGGAGQGTSSANWSFDLQARPGVFDLVLLSWASGAVPDGIAIRRDVAITGEKNLGTIDLTAEGRQALVPVSFTLSNLQAGESASPAVFLDTGSTRLLLSTPGGQASGLTARLAPESALRATDRQRVTLSASVHDAATSQNRTRALGRDIRVGDPTAWTLPDPLGPVTFDATADRLTATWSTLPDHDEIELLREASLFQPSPQFQLYEMVLSRSFLEATAATSATLDFHAIPGFKSQWQLDPAASQFLEFEAIRNVSATETAFATASESISATTSARSPAPAAVDPGAELRTSWVFALPADAGTMVLSGDNTRIAGSSNPFQGAPSFSIRSTPGP